MCRNTRNQGCEREYVEGPARNYSSKPEVHQLWLAAQWLTTYAHKDASLGMQEGERHQLFALRMMKLEKE